MLTGFLEQRAGLHYSAKPEMCHQTSLKAHGLDRKSDCECKLLLSCDDDGLAWVYSDNKRTTPVSDVDRGTGL